MKIMELLAYRSRIGLRNKEKEAAKTLYDLIFAAKKNGLMNLTDGVDNLSSILYYLAFSRVNKQAVRLEDLARPSSYIENPACTSFIGIYALINDSLKGWCNNPFILPPLLTLKDCEISINLLLQKVTDKIES